MTSLSRKSQYFWEIPDCAIDTSWNLVTLFSSLLWNKNTNGNIHVLYIELFVGFGKYTVLIISVIYAALNPDRTGYDEIIFNSKKWIRSSLQTRDKDTAHAMDSVQLSMWENSLLSWLQYIHK